MMEKCVGNPRTLSIDLFVVPPTSLSVPVIFSELEKGPATGVSIFEGAWTHHVSSGAVKDPPASISSQIQERLRENAAKRTNEAAYVDVYAKKGVMNTKVTTSGEERSASILSMLLESSPDLKNSTNELNVAHIRRFPRRRSFHYTACELISSCQSSSQRSTLQQTQAEKGFLQFSSASSVEVARKGIDFPVTEHADDHSGVNEEIQSQTDEEDRNLDLSNSDEFNFKGVGIDAKGTVKVSESDDNVDALISPVLQRRLPISSKAAPMSSSTSWADTSYLDESYYDSLVPKLAMHFPFSLDSFQKQAIMRLERRENVFVAAHTSAGKTVVAEYAIALGRKHTSKVIYTSPIKALSNQKYRDFRQKFDDIGLMTGDIVVNPDASCLIMTTEILRSMLYRGSDIVKDIEWVIFDEVHYVSDAERGVVWEEVIIMLPRAINLIFLSATTPNTIEFSDWIGRTKGRKVYVTSTNERPVPLIHYLFHDNSVDCLKRGEAGFQATSVANAKRRQKLKMMPKEMKPENAKFKADRQSEKLSNAAAIMGNKKASSLAIKATDKSGNNSIPQISHSGDKSSWVTLINSLKNGVIDDNDHILRSGDRKTHSDEIGLLPAVVFVFSKKKCDEIADFLRGQDLLTASGKSEVSRIMDSVKRRMSPSDAEIPQVNRVTEMLRRGIGVHHGGLLPIMKEAVEILFSKSIIKILFATETFAMGVNMPAKCVLFNGFRKHDGKAFRDLFPGEYTQMAGRAGRRGSDKVGTVFILAWNEIPSEEILKTLLTGVPSNLMSQFRITYSMILNFYRVDDLSVEEMMKKSFSEFRTQKALASQNLDKRLTELKVSLRSLEESEKVVKYMDDASSGLLEYWNNYEQCKKTQQDLVSKLVKYTAGKIILSDLLATLLQVGRICFVFDETYLPYPCACVVWGDGCEVSSQVNHRGEEMSSTGKRVLNRMDEMYDKRQVTLLVHIPRGYDLPEMHEQNRTSTTWIETAGEVGEFKYCILKTSLEKIGLITSHGLDTSIVTDMRIGGDRDIYLSIALQSMLDTIYHRNMELSPLDICKEFRVTDFDFCCKQAELDSVCRVIAASSCHRSPDYQIQYVYMYKIFGLKQEIAGMENALSNGQLSLFPDFVQKMKVLRELNYVDVDSLGITLKGRVACEINTSDELLVTEIIFGNVLEELNPPECVGILSALVCQEKSSGIPTLTSRMEIAKDEILELQELLVCVQEQAGISLRSEDEKPAVNFSLADLVYEWARGVSFSEIASRSEVQEGSIVRCINRLDELCKDIRNAARIVGNPSLYRKMEAGSECIKRDIVFAGSIYVGNN